MKKLHEILTSVRSDIDFNNEGKLIDDGVLDSFDIISIISEINSEYDIEISSDDITPENFNSINSISELIKKYTD